MGAADERETRMRAWVLVRVDEEKAVAAAQKIFALNDEKGMADQDNLVVRADVVAGPYDIVVPVDVRSEEELSDVLCRIGRVAGVPRETLIAMVVKHHPDPPHAAYGYVTEEEWKLGPQEFPPGRRPKSPGDNPWG